MKLVFFDTETTSLEKDCRLVQLAILDGQGDDNLLFNANPGVPISLDAMATHHITNKMAAGFGPFEPNRNMVQNLADELVFVAHNAAYDIMVMKNEGVEIKQFICTKKVAQDLLDLPKYNLQYLRYYFDCEFEYEINPHEALSDCIVLKAVFEQLANLVQMKYKIDELQEIHEKMIEISSRPVLLRRISFGKHSGKEFSKIPKDYLQWLNNQTDLDEDVAYTLNFYLNGRDTV